MWAVAATWGTAGRWLGYAALLLMIGAVVFRIAVADQALGTEAASIPRRRAARIAASGAAAYLAAALLRLYGQLSGFAEPGEPIELTLLGPILASDWGRGWMLQVAGAVGALLGFAWAVSRSSPGWTVAAIGVAVATVAAPLTGHAAEHPWGAGVGVVIEAVHLLGAGAWLGTLAMVVAAAPSSSQMPVGTSLALLVRRFSPVALLGASSAIFAGGLLSLAYVGSFAAVLGTDYGRVLLAKLLALSGVLALGAFNWKRVSPTLDTAAGADRLARSAPAELLLGAVVLGVTALLAALAAPNL